ncbi:MAG: CpsB/CapC family capsule biosynthesis tyrosine phosphatase [Syntrophomonadaceae bacterium]|nr:CpsB/CapC family capsule biosynthesis tyrosine phosphatase [Syntrophomonadaceae bacterium]
MLIDLHTHILPGVDDGAQTVEESLAMAAIAIKDGITMVAATPHVIRGVFDNGKQDILAKVDQLNQCLASEGMSLTVMPGAEYRLEPDLPQRLADNELLTINNSGCYLMVELPADLIPENTERVLYEIQLQGVTPIIAHPERNHVFNRHPEILQSYVERGILAQVTSTSITGLFGRSIQKAALNILAAGACQIIASDGHSASKRAPLLAQACREIGYRWGTQYAQTMVNVNPDRIINGLPIPANPPPAKQAFWKRLWI